MTQSKVMWEEWIAAFHVSEEINVSAWRTQ